MPTHMAQYIDLYSDQLVTLRNPSCTMLALTEHLESINHRDEKSAFHVYTFYMPGDHRCWFRSKNWDQIVYKNLSTGLKACKDRQLRQL